MQHSLQLTDQATLKISGKDALRFLQGQLTCNVASIMPGQSCLGALCNPKGRALASFRLWANTDGAFLMQLPQTMLQKVLMILGKYAQFSSVILTDQSSAWQYAGHWHDEETPDVQLQPRGTPPATNATLTEWQIATIRAGIATLLPETSGQFTVHDLDYPRIGAVSFNKGCYTGQEIIARMQYRGKLKQHLYRLQIFSAADYIQGSLLPLSETTNARIVNIVQIANHTYEALAVAPDEAIKHLPDTVKHVTSFYAAENPAQNSRHS